ncbi:MAG TPA: hypothetical protein VFU36_12255 [Jatrophihabitans sp.]|nr:hypothetical protein [Jatrophihabitans sp.]
MPEFRLGFDTRGRLLELTMLIFDSGNENDHPLNESSTAVLLVAPGRLTQSVVVSRQPCPADRWH